MRVSVVIPNYNGRKLLEKHLPDVFACLRTGDEVIVVDDASSDDSVEFLEKSYPTIRLVKHHNTLRYAQSCNDGVAIAKSPLIFLLNSDVSPAPDTLKVIVSQFSRKPLTMVGCCELNAAGIESGKSIGQFRRGMFVHNRAPEQLAGPTVWAAGGSLVIQTEVWKMLGGLDTLFRPAYYEDIDLGYRVWKAGLEVAFEPTARVFHDHESTNATVFGKAKMEVMSYKNSFLFFWKNVTDVSLWMQHVFWLPYQLLVGGWRSHGMLILGFFQATLQIGEVLRSRRIVAKYARLSDKETIQRANEGVL